MGGVSKGQKQIKALCVGLDNSGKSTIINHLKPKDKQTNDLEATVGFLLENFKHGSVNFTMWDMSGQGRYRQLWEIYYREAEAVVFVIDSADKMRLNVVKDELQLLLEHKDVIERPIPILFFANKVDLPAAFTAAEVVKMLELDQIQNRPWKIQSSCALTGEGLKEGIEWMTEHL